MVNVSFEFDRNFASFVSDVESLNTTGRELQRDFIEIIQYATLQLLHDNTPKEQGEFSKSWKVFEKGLKFVVIGTEMDELFQQVVNGTRPTIIRAKNGKALHFYIGGNEFFRVSIKHPGNKANDFFTPILNGLDVLLETLIMSLVKKHWKVFKDIPAPTITKFNVSKTVGLTGTNINKRRGRGSGIHRPKTGQKRLRRVLSRRRRTGRFITSKNVSVG